MWRLSEPSCSASVCVLSGGHLKEFTDGESNFTALLQRAMEMEGVDRETLHQLVFLLMKVSLSIDLCCAALTDSQPLVLCLAFPSVF